ncbi:MAG: hypothetical protein ACI8R4_000063 [Paracoccaceae bacterium]|jgi:hypothetical protein
MTVAGKLEDLRAGLPGCSLAAFGDLKSKITFCISADAKPPQEKLDAICVTAAAFLDGPLTRRTNTVLGGGRSTPLNEAVVLTPDDVQIFVRSHSDAADVLCCVCSGDTDFQAAVQQARATLCDIAGAP